MKYLKGGWQNMKLNIKRKEQGFTIVELLIVIVVIGILAALVLNSFRGVQERARDTKRRTDINAQASQLEVYYTDNGGYPVFTGQVNTDSWLTANLKGADLNAWRAPNQTANSMVNSATPTKDQYGYTPLQDDGTTACTTAPCAKFKLFWYSEKTAAVTSKDSLN
jgi:prepilin-type N-terminal cleavage/methylation domain-containing protein